MAPNMVSMTEFKSLTLKGRGKVRGSNVMAIFVPLFT